MQRSKVSESVVAGGGCGGWWLPPPTHHHPRVMRGGWWWVEAMTYKGAHGPSNITHHLPNATQHHLSIAPHNHGVLGEWWGGGDLVWCVVVAVDGGRGLQ